MLLCLTCPAEVRRERGHAVVAHSVLGAVVHDSLGGAPAVSHGCGRNATRPRRSLLQYAVLTASAGVASPGRHALGVGSRVRLVRTLLQLLRALRRAAGDLSSRQHWPLRRAAAGGAADQRSSEA